MNTEEAKAYLRANPNRPAVFVGDPILGDRIYVFAPNAHPENCGSIHDYLDWGCYAENGPDGGPDIIDATTGQTSRKTDTHTDGHPIADVIEYAAQAHNNLARKYEAGGNTQGAMYLRYVSNLLYAIHQGAQNPPCILPDLHRLCD